MKMSSKIKHHNNISHTRSQCDYELLLSLRPDLGQPEEDHEDEAERHEDNLEDPGHRLLSLLLQDLEEDDIQETPRGDALEDDQCRVVDLLLVGAGEGHPHPDSYGRHRTEDGHVEDGNQGPQLARGIISVISLVGNINFVRCN